MAGGSSGDGDGDITDELIPTGKNSLNFMHQY